MSASRRPEPQPRLRLVTRALDLDEAPSFAAALSPGRRCLVDEVVLAAAGPVQSLELSRELQARLAFRAARAEWSADEPRRRSSRRRHLSPIAMAAASAAGLLAGVAGLSAAAVLPPHAVDQVLSHLGLGTAHPRVHATTTPAASAATTVPAPATTPAPAAAATRPAASACPVVAHAVVNSVHVAHGCATTAPAVAAAGSGTATAAAAATAPGTGSAARGTGGRVSGSTTGHGRPQGGPVGNRLPGGGTPPGNQGLSGPGGPQGRGPGGPNQPKGPGHGHHHQGVGTPAHRKAGGGSGAAGQAGGGQSGSSSTDG